MVNQRYPIPDDVDPLALDAGKIYAALATDGVEVGDVSVTRIGQDGGIVVWQLSINATADLSDDVAGLDWASMTMG